MNRYLTKNFKQVQRQFYLNQGLLELPEHLQSFTFKQENRRAKECYLPKTYSGRITLVRARDIQMGISVDCDPYLGWGNLAVGGVEIHEIPGTHLTMLQEPNVKLLAEKLNLYLP